MRMLRLAVCVILATIASSELGIAGGLGAGTQAGVAGLPTPEAVIKVIAAAPALVDYEGTKVITAIRGSRVETVTVLESHKRPNSLRLEFLSPESIGGRLIVDDGTTAWQYEPSLHMVIQGPSFAKAGAATQVAEGLGHYGAVVEGTEEVIGRATVVLTLAPSAAGHSRRVWVDRATGVILRSEERTPRDGVVFSAFFTRISYSLNLPAALFTFRLPAGARSFSFYLAGDPIADPRQLRHQAGFSVRAPAALPMGYRYRQGTVTRYGPVVAAMATYSDGVSTLTIYQTPTSRMALPQAAEVVRLPGGSGRFLDLGYFRILMWESRGLRMAAVGPLPPEQLAVIAKAVDATEP